MKKVWKTGVIRYFVTVNLRGNDENLRQNSTFLEDGRLSHLSDLALIAGKNALEEGGYPGRGTSGGL